MAKYDSFSREELIELLQKQDKELALKKYGIVWDNEKEPEQVVVDCVKKLPILKSVHKKDIRTNDDDYNIMIEGDNYHALQVLNYTHKEKIDVIYIDPPYNTGNKDFTYNDKFVEKEDGYRHSKWLNFMEKRLELAKELLKDTGIIFISIDDNEQANLKLLCDKTFGENNFLANITIETGGGVYGAKASQINRTFVKTKDYLLVYTKNKSTKGDFSPIYMPADKLFDTHYNKYISNELEIIPLAKYLKSVKWIADEFKKYELPVSVNTIDTLMHISTRFRDYIYNEISTNIHGDWPYTPTIEFSDTNVHLVDGLLVFKTAGGKYRFYRSLSEAVRVTDDYSPSKCLSFATGDLWKGFNQDMTNISDEGGIQFKNGKKPIRLIKRILKWYNNPNSLVLDFFAGSGTTGHAVLDLNRQDGGNRHFILCTNNEGKIAETVCYPRLKNVINGYNRDDAADFVEGLSGNLKYFKTSFVTNSKNTTQTKMNLAEECSEMLCLKTGNFNELQYNNASFKVFSNNKNNKYTCVYFDCFDTNIQSFISEIKKLQGEKELYIFSLTDTIDDSLFKDVSNATLEAIPYKILDLYRKIAKTHIKGINND